MIEVGAAPLEGAANKLANRRRIMLHRPRTHRTSQHPRQRPQRPRPPRTPASAPPTRRELSPPRQRSTGSSLEPLGLWPPHTAQDLPPVPDSDHGSVPRSPPSARR